MASIVSSSQRSTFLFGLCTGLVVAILLGAGGGYLAFRNGLWEPCRLGQVWTVEQGCVNGTPYGPGWVLPPELTAGQDGERAEPEAAPASSEALPSAAPAVQERRERAAP